MTALSLYELNGLVRHTLQLTLDARYWVCAEINEIRANRHCYMELVQKDYNGTTIIAKAKAQIWANRWVMLSAMFENTTGVRLEEGMQVLAEVEVNFHELFGYSLNIIDIDPTYTMGDIARHRKEVLQQLTLEGVIDMNKELPLPRLMQRIAVISSATAAGYGDFCNQLHGNKRGLAFITELFQANMQGQNAETSIIEALNKIAAQAEQWDVVVITRGGGATSDLNCFDSLALAENVAQFPLPVITGIGHERDDTIIDMVSHTKLKTPTAAAEFILHHQEMELNTIEQLYSDILNNAATCLIKEQNHLKMIINKMPLICSNFTSRAELQLTRLLNTAVTLSTQRLTDEMLRIGYLAHKFSIIPPAIINKEKSRIEIANVKINSANPQRILNLGFSITRINGKAIRCNNEVKSGDVITTTLSDGTMTSTVIKTLPK